MTGSEKGKMTEKIEATLKRLAADTSRASSPTPPDPDRSGPADDGPPPRGPRARPGGGAGIGEKQQESLATAVEACRDFARSLDGWLLLTGTYGSGKTHLAAAIANEGVEIGVPTLFLTVPDLLDTLRAPFAAEDTSFEEAFERIRSAPLLILDDFGTHNATEWAREKLFQILNHRYINRLPLVVTMNLPLQ